MSTIKAMQQDVAKILEEAIKITSTRLLDHNLQKNGSLTLEEANFLKEMAREIIQEAAEDFIPDENQETIPTDVVPSINDDEDVPAPQQDKILTDEEGNIFTWNATTGSLDPVDTPTDVPEQDEVLPEQEDNGITESTIASRLLKLL